VGRVRFHSALLPPYVKRVRSVEELISWLYLKGVCTGGYQALSALLGDQAKGLSANTVSRLKQQWSEEYREWSRLDLDDRRHVYWWGDGVYSNARQYNRLCLLVLIGVTEHGHKELIAVELDNNRSERHWPKGLVVRPQPARGTCQRRLVPHRRDGQDQRPGALPLPAWLFTELPRYQAEGPALDPLLPWNVTNKQIGILSSGRS